MPEETVTRQVIIGAEVSQRLDRLRAEMLALVDTDIEEVLLKWAAATDPEKQDELGDQLEELKASRAKILVSNLITVAVERMLKADPPVADLMDELQSSPISRGRPRGRTT